MKYVAVIEFEQSTGEVKNFINVMLLKTSIVFDRVRQFLWLHLDNGIRKKFVNPNSVCVRD